MNILNKILLSLQALCFLLILAIDWLVGQWEGSPRPGYEWGFTAFLIAAIACDALGFATRTKHAVSNILFGIGLVIMVVNVGFVLSNA